MSRWSVVVPVKATASGKSRLGDAGVDRPSLALAIALDTIAAAAQAERVGEVVVVTSDAGIRAGAESLDKARCIADPGMGLNGAVRAGLEVASHDARAALLGDLPALAPADLDAALADAERRERGLVADAEGTGSTLVTWSAPATYATAFGPASAEAHRAAGFVDLDVEPSSTLRRDVDTEEQLRAAADLGLGSRSRALLRAAGAA